MIAEQHEVALNATQGGIDWEGRAGGVCVWGGPPFGQYRADRELDGVCRAIAFVTKGLPSQWTKRYLQQRVSAFHQHTNEFVFVHVCDISRDLNADPRARGA